VTQSRTRRLGIGVALGASAALLAWLLGLSAFLQTVELKTYDIRVRLTADPASARPDIILVTIDDSSIRRMEPLAGRWPWPRVVHSYLIDFLQRGPAKAIVYDVLFTERDRRTFELAGDTWTGKDSDAALARSAARAGNVVFVADVTSDELAQTDPAAVSRLKDGQPFAPDPAFEAKRSLVLPYGELVDAAAAIGHNLMIYDEDGPVRRTAPFVRVGEVGIPSLAVAATMAAGGLRPDQVARDGDRLRVGGAYMPLVDTRLPGFSGPGASAKRLLIRYSGPTGTDQRSTYRSFSFYDLVAAEEQILTGGKPAIDPARFKGAIVVIGTTAAGLSDVFVTPFLKGRMPGAEVHANVIDNLLSRRSLAPLAPAWGVVILAACALAIGLAGVLLPVWPTVGAAFALVAALGGASVVAFSRGVWMDVAEPVLAVAFATFGATAYQYFVEGREKRQVKQVFSRFVAKDVFDQLMADPSRAALGGERRDMTVLFADIRGFTTFTERGRAEDIVAQLNEYFTRMVAVLFEHRGTVDKFVGDMVMALFGAPLADPDHADHAVEAALGMLRALDDLNRQWAAAGRPRLDIGIGLNTGDMVAGNIGSDTIMSYTVIGDAVNLAARLESLNKEYGTHIIVSDETRSRLKGRYDIQPLGTVTVKGKTAPVAIFEIRPPA